MHVARFAQRNRADWLRVFVLGPKQMLGNEKNHGVLCMHRRPEQSSGVGRRAWNHNVQTGIMGEHRFVCLTVPQTATRQIGAIRRINHCRAFPIPKRSPPQSRDVGHKLIEAGINEIDELQLEYRSLSVSSQSACDTENRGFSER